jgi:hypothetical protein
MQNKPKASLITTGMVAGVAGLVTLGINAPLLMGGLVIAALVVGVYLLILEGLESKS